MFLYSNIEYINKYTINNDNAINKYADNITYLLLGSLYCTPLASLSPS